MHAQVQIVPSPPSLPGWATVVQRPAHGQGGTEETCAVCAGAGRLRHEECRRCGGKGTLFVVQAARLDLLDETRRKVVEDLLDGLDPQAYRWQTTIRLSEVGGGMTNTGSARIIAGLKGEPLTSVGGWARCGGEHALFWVHAALVVGYGHHRGEGKGSVRRVGVDRTSRHRLGIDNTELWRFTASGSSLHEEIEVSNPDLVHLSKLQFPAAAVAAAIGKSLTYHCRSARYVSSGGAHGPSGALRGAGAAFGGLPSPFKGPGIGY